MRLFKKLRKRRRISYIPKKFLLPPKRTEKIISEYDLTLKVVVFGAPGIGKATLLKNYAEKVFDTVPEKNIYYIIKKEVT